MNSSLSAPCVYYARGVEGLQWDSIRRRAARARTELARYEIEVIDPVALGRAAELKTPAEIVESDLHHLKGCDAVLMDMSIAGRNYVGCCCELVYAFQWQIPAIVYVGRSGNGSRKWLIYHSSAVCRSLRCAVETTAATIKTRRSSR